MKRFLISLLVVGFSGSTMTTLIFFIRRIKMKTFVTLISTCLLSGLVCAHSAETIHTHDNASSSQNEEDDPITIKDNRLYVKVVTDNCNSYVPSFKLDYACKPSPPNVDICIVKPRITIGFMQSKKLCSGWEIRSFDFYLVLKNLIMSLSLNWIMKRKL